MGEGNYKKFALMLAISFIIMYIVMFLNVDRINHIYISTTRIYMALLMVAPMALLMLTLMGKMYPNKKTNMTIMASSVIVFIGTLILLRTQTPVGDVQYMKAMIPHHSSAILVSKHANLEDPEVIKLSKEIIESQEREIKEMESALKRISN